jgi:cysteine synthase
LKYHDSMRKSQVNSIGSTPLIRLGGFVPHINLFAKLESFNPLGSVKDRAAWGMILQAERKGQLKAGSKIVEPTSGNTGIALSWISQVRGYELILTMPETMSIERRKIIKFLGAKMILTKGEKGMKGAVEKALEVAEKEKAFMPNQFANQGNVQIHFETTGPEIWNQMQESVDIAVFTVGTGGTLTGAGKFLKTKNPRIKIIAVEPADSAVLSGGSPGAHKIQGIGAGFVPDILEVDLIDEIEKVTNEEAIKTSQELAMAEGIFVGISSGAAAHAAKIIAQKNPHKRVVTLFADTAERYLSTDLFNNIEI